MAENKLPAEAWLNLQTRKIDELASGETAARKMRQKSELVLVVACLMAVIYTYPVHNIENNPAIEIGFIDLEIPLEAAISVFPTVIAAFYLIFLFSAGRHWALQFAKSTLDRDLNKFQVTGEIDSSIQFQSTPSWGSIPIYLLLPSILLSDDSNLPHLSGISGRIVNIFIGTVFTLLPYVSAIFITNRAWELLQWKYLLFWNVLCLFIMGLTCVSTSRGKVLVVGSIPPKT